MWNGAEEAGYSWVCLSTVAIGPIFEEVLFRGLVYSVAERGVGGYAPAILSSVLFGLWHGQPVQMIYATVVGVALGLVYMKTKNLLYPILLHMLINLYSTLPPPCTSEGLFLQAAIPLRAFIALASIRARAQRTLALGEKRGRAPSRSLAAHFVIRMVVRSQHICYVFNSDALTF